MYYVECPDVGGVVGAVWKLWLCLFLCCFSGTEKLNYSFVALDKVHCTTTTKCTVSELTSRLPWATPYIRLFDSESERKQKRF